LPQRFGVSTQATGASSNSFDVPPQPIGSWSMAIGGPAAAFAIMPQLIGATPKPFA